MLISTFRNLQVEKVLSFKLLPKFLFGTVVE